MNPTALGLLFASLTALSWSILSIGLKVALRFTDAETMVCFRFIVAFSTLFAVLLVVKPKSLAILKKPPLLAVLGGIFLASNFLGFTKFIEYTSPSIAQIFIQLAPLLFLCVGVLYFKESFSRVQFLGGMLAVLGFYLFGQHSFEMMEKDILLPGFAWILFSVVTWALYATTHKILMKRQFKPQSINLVLYTVSAICLVPFSTPTNIATWSGPTWILMSYLGLNTFMAYGFLAEAIKRAPANLVSLIIIVNPVITLFITTYLVEVLQIDWIQKEELSPGAWIGAFCVLTGIGIAVLFSKNISQKNTD